MIARASTGFHLILATVFPETDPPATPTPTAAPLVNLLYREVISAVVILGFMSWVRKSPFAPHEDVVAHLVVLLCREANDSEIPFSGDEERLLADEARRGESVDAELEQRTKKLIEQLLEKEQGSEMREDPRILVIHWNGPNRTIQISWRWLRTS